MSIAISLLLWLLVAPLFNRLEAVNDTVSIKKVRLYFLEGDNLVSFRMLCFVHLTRVANKSLTRYLRILI